MTQKKKKKRLYDSQWCCLLDLNFRQKLIPEIVLGVQNFKEGLIDLDLGYQPWFSDLIWFEGMNDSASGKGDAGIPQHGSATMFIKSYIIDTCNNYL